MGIASVDVFVAHFWSAVLWHSFMRFTTLSAMFSTQIAAGDPWKYVNLFGIWQTYLPAVQGAFVLRRA
jgi:hypothetical protein